MNRIVYDPLAYCPGLMQCNLSLFTPILLLTRSDTFTKCIIGVRAVYR